MRRDWEKVLVTIGLVSDPLQDQIYIASLDVGLDVGSKSWLVVFLIYQLSNLFDAKMAC